MEYTFQKGGYLINMKNSKIVFTKKIKKLGLEGCENLEIILNEKCFTRVELIRCHNIKLIFKKELYNLRFDLCSNINIEVNKKFKDLLYLYTCSCMNIEGNIPIKWSMFQETYQNSYYLKEHFVERLN